MKTKILLMYLLSTLIVFGGCNKWNKAANGAVIGGVAGGAVGALIGYKAGNTAVGAIIGAGVGGIAGAAIGRYMDKQAAELQKDLQGATVTRVGEGIKITFKSGILYDIDSDKLKPAAQSNIQDLAKTLNKYKDTQVLIEGHTDSTGSADHNQALSDRRATSVTDYLKTLMVAPERLSTVGYGPRQPIASNATKQGREQNRRVEIAIFADKKLKKAAEKGEIQ
jgi:outer membrane protein OmpA-like peptidoglycan-associated protein